MPRKRRTPQPDPDGLTPATIKVFRSAIALTPAERQQLIELLQAHQEAEELEAVADAKERESRLYLAEQRGRGARFEFKVINGYGPYRYLRYRSKGVHRSVYAEVERRGRRRVEG